MPITLNLNIWELLFFFNEKETNLWSTTIDANITTAHRPFSYEL